MTDNNDYISIPIKDWLKLKSHSSEKTLDEADTLCPKGEKKTSPKSFLQQTEELKKKLNKFKEMGFGPADYIWTEKEAKELKEKILKGCGKEFICSFGRGGKNICGDKNMYDERYLCPNCKKAIKKVNEILGEQE